MHNATISNVTHHIPISPLPLYDEKPVTVKRSTYAKRLANTKSMNR